MVVAKAHTAADGTDVGAYYTSRFQGVGVEDIKNHRNVLAALQYSLKSVLRVE